jgi:hypothetical protein
MTETRRVDLDAARAARLEQEGEAPVVVLGGKEFTLPGRLPAKVLVGLAGVSKGDLSGFGDALDALFGDRTADALAAGLEIEDLDDIIEGAYGVAPGEASASGA